MEGIPDLELCLEKEQSLQARFWNPGRYQIKDRRGGIFTLEADSLPVPIPVDGPWMVHFQKGRGAPDSVRFETLRSWTESDNPGIRYFSGSAIYEATVAMEDSLFGKAYGFTLDLGGVREIAEITLNGQSLGIDWTPPFRADVSGILKPGENSLTVVVTNLWPNRLIGDQFLPEAGRIAVTNIVKFTKASPLLDSGLLGPVKILICEKRDVRF